MKLIFLDIDGVMNCDDYYVSNNFAEKRDEYGHLFYDVSVYWLNKLINETEAKIVISSTWRMSGKQIMKEMWKHRNMAGEVIDITPILPRIGKRSAPRGLEIDYWLYENQVDSYMILDDDSDMLYCQRNNFIEVSSKSGFGEEHYLQAKKILGK